MDNLLINEKNTSQEKAYNNSDSKLIETQSKENNNIIPKKIDFDLNSKYENALFEELYNSKRKRRSTFINPTPNKEKIMFDLYKNKYDNKALNDKTNDNNDNDKNDKEKNERFKDFDDILFLEETKDKKRKNKSTQKIINLENYLKVPNLSEKRASFDINGLLIKQNINENLDIIEEVVEKEEKNKIDLTQENKDNKDNKEFIQINPVIQFNNENKKENEIEIKMDNDICNFNDIKQDNFIDANIDKNKDNNPNEDINKIININNSNENNINNFISVSLDNSEDKKTEDKKIEEQKKNSIEKEKDENEIEKENIFNNEIKNKIIYLLLTHINQ
jgi:hypothetical protein